MKHLNIAFRLGFAFALVATMIFTSTTPAKAGFNGQQILLTACNAVRVTIKGQNQNGTIVTYTMDKVASNCGPILIQGMWWKGSITVTPFYYVSSEYPKRQGTALAATIPQVFIVNYYPVIVPAPTERTMMDWRGQTWLNDKVKYNPNSLHDGYRQDCSGYVSFIWLLPKPGARTSNMSTYANQISYDSLLPGDALNNPGDHIVLFMGWIDKNKGIFTAYEENGDLGTWKGTLILNKATGVIKHGNIFYPGKYIAIRRKGL